MKSVSEKIQDAAMRLRYPSGTPYSQFRSLEDAAEFVRIQIDGRTFNVQDLVLEEINRQKFMP